MTLAVSTAALTLLAASTLAVLSLTGAAAPVPFVLILGQAVVVAALGCYLLSFHWFVAWTALQVSGMNAVVVVAAELGVAAGLPWLLHRIAGA